MQITGYIEDINLTRTILDDGSERKNLCITLREELQPQADHGLRGVTFFVKQELVENTVALLQHDPDRRQRYEVRFDGYLKKKLSATQPGRQYYNQYNRAWSFCLAEE